MGDVILVRKNGVPAFVLSNSSDLQHYTDDNEVYSWSHLPIDPPRGRLYKVEAVIGDGGELQWGGGMIFQLPKGRELNTRYFNEGKSKATGWWWYVRGDSLLGAIASATQLFVDSAKQGE